MKKTLILTAFLLSLLVANPAVFAEEAPVHNCSYQTPDDVQFEAKTVSVRRKLKVEPEEVFRVKVFMQNRSNVPWFSADSNCGGNKVHLGTDRERDRLSPLYLNYTDEVENTNWLQRNRIGLDQERVDPGAVGSFTFWARAGKEADVMKEYFTPVVEGGPWIESGAFDFELMVGETNDSLVDVRQKLMLSRNSGSVKDINLDGEKMLLVDISDQTVTIHLDNRPLLTFPASTGAPSTPTPYGETTITLKQHVRVGSSPPHYIMPRFMWFRAGGYGFHALPSLANDNGVFWTEALNHIGVPVSHGCVRLLPEDADFLFNFAEIGTRVKVAP